MGLLNRLTGRLLAIQVPLRWQKRFAQRRQGVFSTFIRFHQVANEKERILLHGAKRNLKSIPLRVIS